jgi:hypothetical protein
MTQWFLLPLGLKIALGSEPKINMKKSLSSVKMTCKYPIVNLVIFLSLQLPIFFSNAQENCTSLY